MTILQNFISRGSLFLIVSCHVLFAQWELTPGPRTGQIAGMVWSAGGLYAGIDAYGVYFSENSGATWSPVDTGWPSGMRVYRIAVSKNVVCASTVNGVFRTVKNGSGWVPVSSGLPVEPYVMFFETSDTSIYAGIDKKGIYKSIDNGNSWTLLRKETSVLSMAIFGKNIIVGTPYDASLSNDNGVTWKSVGCPYANVFKIHGDTLYAGTYTGIYRSLTKGATWAPVDTGMSNTMVYSMELMGNDIFVGYGYGHAPVIGVHRSGDNGATWTCVNSGLADTNISSLTAIDTVIFAGTGEGIFKSTDRGANWTAVNAGLPTTAWKASVGLMAAAGQYIYAVTSRGLCVSDNNGATWSMVDPGIPVGTVITSLATHGNTVFAGTSNSGILASTTTGKIWSHADSGLPPGAAVWDIAVSGSVMFASISKHGLFRSTDNGLHWNGGSTGSVDTGIGSFTVMGQNIFASIGKEGIYRSTDNGSTWSVASRLQVETPSGPITAVTLLFANGTDLFAGFPVTRGMMKYGGGLYKSTDYGATWQVTGKTGVTPCMATCGNDLFAGVSTDMPTPNSVDISSDGGTTWTDFSSGLPFSSASCLLVSDSYLFLGRSDGIWRQPLPKTPVSEARTVLACPVLFDIKSARLNTPFAAISFLVLQPERIIVTVYNVQGQKVMTLVDRHFEIGHHSVAGGTGKMVPGFYMARFQAGSARYSRGFTIVR